jgi:hypothetical protein
MAGQRNSKGKATQTRPRYLSGTNHKVERVVAVVDGKKKNQWRDPDGNVIHLKDTELRDE